MVAVDRVDVQVPRHQLTVIAGPSGSGKSTLLGLLACMDRPDEGEVWLDGQELTGLSRRRRRQLRRARVGIVLPQPSDNLLDRLDADANLAWSARQARRRRWSYGGGADRAAGHRRPGRPHGAAGAAALGRRAAAPGPGVRHRG